MSSLYPSQTAKIVHDEEEPEDPRSQLSLATKRPDVEMVALPEHVEGIELAGSVP
jgi:hypothetical protein